MSDTVKVADLVAALLKFNQDADVRYGEDGTYLNLMNVLELDGDVWL
ncbi:hypothetical protein SEA_OCTOBIEN14_128 [Gordonia phage Octobien14]|uniref:Uncharacterized protein n=1 Tax=Gordonia phage Octobien14 TaxID=2483673 RepID=A0A3G3MA33_9CAUD|nr:hypothetical protein L3Y22_gp116 [Gordonia phage Octobien14]AYR03263.1 hypothetical protein SEA_OCTOBIEN14_128 [Gordonia phage Octobien14]